MSNNASTSRLRSTNTGLPRLRWYWDFEEVLTDEESRHVLSLLIALLDTSALRTAAERVGISYRTAWGLLKRCEDELGLVLVTMRRGRGTALTPLGTTLVELDGAARLSLGEVHRAWEGRMHSLVGEFMRAHGEALRLQIVASHDLALADWVEHGRRVPFDVTWRGSEDALAAFSRGECDAAGFHIPETWSSTQLRTWLDRWLTPGLHVCIPVMRRSQGLVVPKGNPLRLRTLADVSRRHARLVNRQRGSGTRSLIDELLAASGIAAESINGYAHEEFTHEAVAAAVASGIADVGFAIESAASRFDLDFVPLVSDRYGFAMGRSVLSTDSVKNFLARLNGRTFQQRLSRLPGYVPLQPITPVAWKDFLAV